MGLWLAFAKVIRILALVYLVRLVSLEEMYELCGIMCGIEKASQVTYLVYMDCDSGLF